jgi:hypothetical protein
MSVASANSVCGAAQKMTQDGRAGIDIPGGTRDDGVDCIAIIG